MNIRAVLASDAASLAEIYNHYIAHSVATFEEEALPLAAMMQRVSDIAATGLPWLVAERDGHIAGYAYARRWRERRSYRFSVETTVYVRPGLERGGVGSALYGALLPLLKGLGIHTAIGGIALPNDASVTLHEKFGFVHMATFREVGFKFEQWVDVGYWQRML